MIPSTPRSCSAFGGGLHGTGCAQPWRLLLDRPVPGGLLAKASLTERLLAGVLLAGILSAGACGSSAGRQEDAEAPPRDGRVGDAAPGDAHAAVDASASRDGGGGQDDGGCVPPSCVSLGAECGALDDTCGGTLDCGACPAPQVCGFDGVANQCGGMPPALTLLSHSVDMQILFKTPPWGSEQTITHLIDTAAQGGALLGLWAINTWRMEPFDEAYFTDLAARAAQVHAAIPDLALMGGLMEFIARDAVEGTYYPDESRPFSYDAMMPAGWPWVDHWGPGWSVPDVRQPETRKFYQYLAERWIDLGVEAVCFGQVQLTGSGDDLNDSSLAPVITDLRAYAATHARRQGLLVGAQATPFLRSGGHNLLDFLEGALHLEPDSVARQVAPISAVGSAIYGAGDIHPLHPANNPDDLPVLVELDNCCADPPDDITRLALWPATAAPVGYLARADALAELSFYVKAIYPRARLSLPLSKTLVGGGSQWQSYCLTPGGQTPSGFNRYWFDANLCGVGQTLIDVGQGHPRDPSTDEGFVRHVYWSVLGRPADASGLAYWAGELASGQRTRAEVLEAFFATAEYAGRGRTDRQFVNDAHHAILLRGPNADPHPYLAHTLDELTSALAGGATRQSIVALLLGTAEFGRLSP